MDLVLRRADGTETPLDPDSADFAMGFTADGKPDENDFELSFGASPDQPEFEPWGIVYAQGTPFGGVLSEFKSDDGAVRWGGPTWTGLLAGKVLVPDAGQDYLTVSGELNAVLSQLIERTGLTGQLAASGSNSRMRVDGYRFPLYCDSYTGINGMLGSAGAKLSISHDGDRAVLSALPAKDWSEDAELVAGVVDVRVEADHRPVNHLVCRGEDEKQNRVSAELYLDGSGNVSETQTFTGAQEMAEYYDYTNADREKLIEDGTKRLKEGWEKSRKVEVSISDGTDRFDIGDTVAGTDPANGATVSARVRKKVCGMSGDSATVSYECG